MPWSYDELAEDTLSAEEWTEIEQIELILKPFQQVTKRLEGNAVYGHHGSIWEALPTIELLLRHLEGLKEVYKDNSFLSTSINLAWVKLEKYYALMDTTPIYAAGLFLHPKYRFEYFKKRWNTKALRPYQKSTLTAIRELYNEQYRDFLSETTPETLDSEQQEGDILSAFLNSNTTPKDEFETYLNGVPTALADDADLFKWWANSGLTQLAPMAFDILSIPAMSAETERIFSGAKLTISPARNRLSEDIIEATECLNRWYRAGF